METNIITLLITLFDMACGVIGTLIILDVFWPKEFKKFIKSIRCQK
jgi:hypothetical protein